MAYRFLLILFGFFAFTSSSFASGIVPGVSGGFKSTWSGSAYGPPAQTFYGPSRQSIADQFCPLYVAIYGTTYGTCALSADGNRINANSTSWNNFGPPIFPDPTYQACPVDSTNVNGSCVCNDPLISNGTACVPDPSAAYCTSMAGSFVVGSWNSTTMSLSTPKAYCQSTGLGNCAAILRPIFCGTYDSGVRCEGEGTLTGATCTPSDPLLPTAPDSPTSSGVEPLPKGMCPGTVNGLEVTVPCKDTTTSTKKESVNDDGNGNVEAKTENKVTACTGSSCNTTTTTTTTVNGTSSTTTNTTTQSKGQFCAENAGSPECGDGEGSAFSGTCESNFVCDGDAVQCATAKAVNDQYCIFEMSDSTKSLVQSVLDGTAVVDPRTTAQDISVGVFDQNNPFGSSCPGDISAQVHGFSLTIPLASLCGWLQIIGNMLVAVSLFGATLFVVKGGNT